MSKANKSPASRFGAFLSRHAGEIIGVASAFRVLAQGVGLPSNERAKVEAAADALAAASESILAGIEKVQDLGAPTASQVKAVVAEILPDLLGGLVEAEVRKRLAEKDGAAN
jgi:hypothetical protein